MHFSAGSTGEIHAAISLIPYNYMFSNIIPMAIYWRSLLSLITKEFNG